MAGVLAFVNIFPRDCLSVKQRTLPSYNHHPTFPYPCISGILVPFSRCVCESEYLAQVWYIAIDLQKRRTLLAIEEIQHYCGLHGKSRIRLTSQ